MGAELLGVSCGNEIHQRAHVASVVQKIQHRVGLIAKMGALHAASAFSTLRLCGAFPSVNYFMRCNGSSPHLHLLSLHTRAAFETIVGPMTDVAWLQAQLPIRLGGCGLRNPATFSSAAYVASSAAAAHLLGQFTELHLAPLPLLQLEARSESLANNRSVQDIVLPVLEGLVAAQKLQKKISLFIDDAAAASQHRLDAN